MFRVRLFGEYPDMHPRLVATSAIEINASGALHKANRDCSRRQDCVFDLPRVLGRLC